MRAPKVGNSAIEINPAVTIPGRNEGRFEHALAHVRLEKLSPTCTSTSRKRCISQAAFDQVGIVWIPRGGPLGAPSGRSHTSRSLEPNGPTTLAHIVCRNTHFPR